MAQTRGFQIDIAPRYTPVNPQFAAIDPTQFLRGATESQRFVAALDKILADRAIEAELAALRPSKIKAGVATNENQAASATADMANIGKRAQLEGLKIDTGIKNQPKKGALEYGTLDAELGLLPDRTTAEKTRLKVETAKGQGELGLLEKRISNEGRKLDAETLSLEEAELLREDKLNLVAQQLQNDLKLAKTAVETQAALQKAKLAESEAEAAYKNAQANYYNSGGSTAKINPYNAMASLSMIENRIRNAKYPLASGRTGTYAQAEAEAFNTDGTPKREGMFWDRRDVKPSGQFLSAKQQLNELYTQADAIQSGLSGGNPLPKPGSIAPPPDNGGSVKSFATAADAQAAANSGLLKDGDRISIGGKMVTVKQKQ